MKLHNHRSEPWDPTRDSFSLDTGLLGPEEYIFFDYDFVDHRFPNDIAIQCLTQEMHDRGPGQPLMLREICRAVMHDDKRSGEVGRLEVPQDLWDDATVSQLDEIALLAMVQIYRLARGWSSSVRREGGDGGGGGDSNVAAVMAGTAAVVSNF
ncbi:unnamed protein product [Zymoseptoria tritici ST99CH_1E4]|uniref:Uncharacterized protein n=1 Tax=Zymoseptoria tritici ST99CH_1E4 TaxID=1276532 RepID=A0A2H1FYJ2_ZYMTR|nr:unnamed protein product [Zymoseptoria tritici ST99CH_1E4]